MTDPPARRSGASIAAVALAATLFGTAGVARGLGPDGPSSWFVGAWRLTIGGVTLLVAAAVVGQTPWRRRSTSDSGPAPRPRPLTALAGGAATLGYQLAFFAAVDRVGVGPAAVVTIGTGPVVAGLADLVRRGRPPTARWWGGVAVAVIGIVGVAAGAPAGDSAPGVWTGWLFAVGSGVCYPLYGLAAQELMDDRPPLGAIATVFGVGAVLALPVGLLAERGSVGGVPAGTFALVAYLGIGATGLAYALWAIGLSRLSLADTVALTLLEPVSAVVLALLLLDEPIGSARLGAMVLVLVGIGIATGPAATRRPAIAP